MALMFRDDLDSFANRLRDAIGDMERTLRAVEILQGTDDENIEADDLDDIARKLPNDLDDLKPDIEDIAQRQRDVEEAEEEEEYDYCDYYDDDDFPLYLEYNEEE